MEFAPQSDDSEVRQLFDKVTWLHQDDYIAEQAALAA